MENQLNSLMNNIPGFSKNDLNVDDELAELNDEISNEKHSHKNSDELLEEEINKKDEDDIALEQLEKEDLLDSKENLNEEKEENKEENKENKEKEEEIELPWNKNVKEGIDLYNGDLESVIHNEKNMKSLKVMTYEMKLCDKIIEYKKKYKFDDEDIWENKKYTLNISKENMETRLTSGLLKVYDYALLIKKEFNIDSENLNRIIKNDKINKDEIPVIEIRIKKRLELMKEEIEEIIEILKEDGINLNIDEFLNKNDEKKEEKKDEKKEEKKEENKEEKKEKILTEEEIKIENEKKEKISKIIEIINKKIDEFKIGFEYFKEYNFETQKNLIISQAKELVNIKKKLESDSNYYSSIKIEDFPKEISPEFIFGNDKKKILELKQDFLEKLLNQIKEYEKEIKIIKNNFNLLNNIQKKKLENEIKNKILDKQNKLNKLIQIKDILKEKFKNNFFPIPKFNFSNEIIKYKKFYEINEKNIEIYIGKIDYINKNYKYYLYLTLIDSDNNEIKNEYVYIKKNNLFDKTLIWNFDEEIFKNFYKYLLKIEIYSKGIFISSLEGEINLKLLRLKDKCDINGFFNIDLINKNQNPKLEIKIKIQKPLNGKNDERFYYKKVFTVEKLIPPFNEYLQKKRENNNNNNNNNDNNNLNENKNEKKEQNLKEINKNKTEQTKKINNNNNNNNQTKKINNNNKTNIQKNNNNLNNKPTENKNINIEIPKINNVHPDKVKEYINNPNCLECLLTIKVLENASNKIKEENKERAMNRNVRQFYNQIVCMKTMMIQNISEGNLSKEDYIKMIEGHLQRDKILFEYFKKINDEKKKNIIFERIKIMNEELKELK